jgi:dihydroneopterin aldolase
MQLLKISLCRKLIGSGTKLQDIVSSMDIDVYSLVESGGKEEVYKVLDSAYAAAEDIIPTKFKDYEYSHRDEYYMVRNNFYFLFTLAEKIKKEFFANPHVLQVTVGAAEAMRTEEYSHVHASRWKLAVRYRGKLSVQKEFPQIALNTDLTKMALHGDIYDIIYRFLDRIYETGELSEYQIINLTGQSCKIDIFRDALKEFIPGKLMRGGRGKAAEDFRLKLTCLDGAIRYVRDKRLGLAKVDTKAKSPLLPYELRATTHTGEDIVLLHPLQSKQVCGSVSRSLGSVELRLHLRNTRGEEKYVYHVLCAPDNFKTVTYEDIQEDYRKHISQDEVDAIENGEVRYFVWLESDMWAFSVVPVARENEQLQIGERQVLPFEVESWLVNFFDGTW